MSNGNRYGISLLSKNRYAEAYNEELMIDKSTGEILVKTTTGDVISYDYNSRVNNAIRNLRANALELGVFGTIGSITFDNQYPFVVSANTNYMAAPLTINTSNMRILFHIDMDSVKINSNGFSNERGVDVEPNVTIECNFVHLDDVETRVGYTKKVSEWNKFVLDPESINAIKAIQITKFQLEEDTGVRNILNGLYIVIDDKN